MQKMSLWVNIKCHKHLNIPRYTFTFNYKNVKLLLLYTLPLGSGCINCASVEVDFERYMHELQKN